MEIAIMGVVDDVLKHLERWEVWRRMSATPDRVDALEKRVTELEAMLGGTYPPDVCRHCGKRGLRLDGTIGPDRVGKMREQWNCRECNAQEDRIAK
jgi:hypothetical protein